jgi:hypothetical protein
VLVAIHPSARPPTAPARAPRPRPTAATPGRSRSARPSRSTAPLSPARSFTTRGSRCGGVTQLSPKEGYSLGDEGGGWTHTVYTLTPGIPGDSGSAFLSKDGAALGTLSTVAIAPVTGSNGVGDLATEFNYMKANSAFGGVSPALGTEPFVAGSLP